MPPLILHNVPDEELYIGEDGIQRPYAMVFPGDGNHPSLKHPRRAVPETGSFGKSTRRSRSRTGTPAARREDPTIAAGDAIFSQFFASKNAEAEAPQRRTSGSASLSQQNLLSLGAPLAQIDGNGGGPASRSAKQRHQEPTEVILRGFLSSQQYAAIREFERIGGRICEDYPRDAPIEQRRFQNDLRDPATLRSKPMTPEERAKALRFAGGDHWIKVTFESAEAAEIAIESSPQIILGHLVYAELYRGVPPTQDEAIPSTNNTRTPRRNTQTSGVAPGFNAAHSVRQSSTLPRSMGAPAMSERGRGQTHSSFSPESQASTRTIDTGTVASTTSTSTLTGPTTAQNSQNTSEMLFCRKIPTAKRAQLLPATQALLPQPSMTKRILSKVPLYNWFTTDIIGSAVPRTDQGDFDWGKATLYWKIVWYVDCWTGWFDICGNEKDE